MPDKRADMTGYKTTAVIFAALLLAGCSTVTRFTGHWTSEDYRDRSVRAELIAR